QRSIPNVCCDGVLQIFGSYIVEVKLGIMVFNNASDVLIRLSFTNKSGVWLYPDTQAVVSNQGVGVGMIRCYGCLAEIRSVGGQRDVCAGGERVDGIMYE